MPFVHWSTYTIRFDECDAYGHLFHANYARFMQDAAFEASTASGYGLDQYKRLRQLWLVRNTEIEFLRPVRYRDQIKIKTWVIDLRRSSSRRMYEFYSPDESILLARAHMDWVYVDARTHQPAHIPPEMKTAFYPEGIPSTFPPRQPFPHLPARPDEVFNSFQKVQWKDIDALGMVNNPCYLDFATECGFKAVGHFGWSWEKMTREGFAIFIRKVQVRYLKPARYGDELLISTWVSDVKRATATRHYEITREKDSTVLARLHTVGVWIQLETEAPMRIPQAMLQDFSTNIVPKMKVEGMP
jgi:acyl-CoA thioester hydrolase